MSNREPRQAWHPADLRACVLAVRGCRDPAAAHQSTLLPERPSRRSSTPAREPPVSDADRAACPPTLSPVLGILPSQHRARHTALCTGSSILALSRDSRGDGGAHQSTSREPCAAWQHAVQPSLGQQDTVRPQCNPLLFLSSPSHERMVGVDLSALLPCARAQLEGRMGNHGAYETTLSDWSGLVGHPIGWLSPGHDESRLYRVVAVTYMQSCVAAGDTPSTSFTPSPYRGLACPPHTGQAPAARGLS